MLLLSINLSEAGGLEGGEEQLALSVSPTSNGSMPTLIVGGLAGSSAENMDYYD